MNFKKKLLSLFMAGTFVLGTAMPFNVYAQDPTAPVASASNSLGTIVMAGQYEDNGQYNKEVEKTVQSLDDVLGPASTHEGLYNNLKTIHIAWSDMPVVNGQLAEGAKVFLPTDKVKDAFPGGLTGGEKLYAHYFAFEDIAKDQERFNRLINDGNKVRINADMLPEDTLPETKLYKNDAGKVIDLYEKKDDVNKINEVVLTADFEMNKDVALLVFKNPGAGYSWDPIFTRSYKDVDFENLETEVEHTYVDLHVKLDDRLDVPESFYASFKGYSWRPVFVFDKDNNKLNIRNPKTDADLGNNKDSFNTLVSNTDPEVIFEVVNPNKIKEFTIRVLVRDPKKNENINVMGSDGKSGADKVLEKMTLSLLSTKEINAKLNKNFTQEELNKKVVKVPDAVAEDLANKGENTTLDVVGDIKGKAVAAVDYGVNDLKLAADIDMVKASTLNIGFYKADAKPPVVKLNLPVINKVYKDDTKITGTSEAGAAVFVTLPNGEVINVVAGQDGSWTVNVPQGVNLKAGEKITAKQEKDGHTPSDNATTTVLDRPSGGGGGGGGGSTPSTPAKTDKVEVPKDLNTVDHIKYVYGYPDGKVKPNGKITRAEVTSIYYRLLTDSRRNAIFTKTNNFRDVKTTNWYNKAVSSMEVGKYVMGYPDGTFGGNKGITRAEFVAITARFMEAKKGTHSFSDVKANHWASDYIATSEAYGWIKGYEDGTFRPDQEITRAEAMTIINRLLSRGVGEEGLVGLDYIKWPDNIKGAWYYYEVIEATNDHKYTGTRPSEKWSSLVIDYKYDIAKYEHPGK